jgi:hypothetical protein
MEDTKGYSHLLGGSVSGAYYTGFIADVLFANYRIADFLGLTLVSGGGNCSNCTDACPATLQYTDCLRTCIGDECDACAQLITPFCPELCDIETREPIAAVPLAQAPHAYHAA